MSAFGVTTGTQASPATDYTGLYEALKVVFEPSISENLVMDTEAYDLITQDSGIEVKQGPDGRYIEMAHYAADGGGFGARREGGALPKSTPPSIFNGRVNLRKNHMTVEMSGETMRRVQQGEASWLSWAKQALPNATRRLRHHLDRQSIGFGQGVLGKITALTAVGGGAYVAGSPATITVGLNAGLTGLSGAIFNFLRNDLIVAGNDINGTTIRVGEMRITSVDNKNSKINVDAGATAMVVGDFLAVGDLGGSSFPGAGAPVEMMGLLGIVDDGSVRATFQNQPRTGASAVAEYQATVVDATAAGYSTVSGGFREDLLLAADDDAFTLGGGQPNVILGHRLHERAYFKDLRSRERLLDSKSLMDQGGKNRGFTINLNGRPVGFRVARKWAPELCTMLETGNLKKWQNGAGFSFDTTTGSVFERVVTGTARYDAYFAVGTVEGEMGSTAPAHNVIIKNIAPTA